MLSYYEVEWTDENGKARKGTAQAINGIHTEELLREHFNTHKVFGPNANITSIRKITDSAQQAEAQAARPTLPAEVVKNIQVAENAGGVSPGGGQPAAEAFPPASQPAPAQA